MAGVWMFDECFQQIQYSYFNTGPIYESSSGTYADTSAPIHVESVGWNHPFPKCSGSLIAHGLTIRHFAEYDYSPFDCFQNGIKIADKK